MKIFVGENTGFNIIYKHSNNSKMHSTEEHYVIEKSVKGKSLSKTQLKPAG